jgi:hypothetical protein
VVKAVAAIVAALRSGTVFVDRHGGVPEAA